MTERVSSLALSALIVALFVVFSWAIAAGAAARLGWEFARLGWDTAERVI